MELTAVVEALIFASPEPITAKGLARCIRSKITLDGPDSEEPGSSLASWSHLKAPDVEGAIAELNAAYESEGRAFRLAEGPQGWRMVSLPEFADWIAELFPGQKPA